MAEGHDIALVWEKIAGSSMCILIAEDGVKPRARPMTAFVRPEDCTVYVLTGKDSQIADLTEVCLMFKGSGESYVALNGAARLTNDREKIRELWNATAKAWWDSPDDPSIRLLKVMPEEAEIWETPGLIATYVAMLAAAVVGTPIPCGENLKVKM